MIEALGRKYLLMIPGPVQISPDILEDGSAALHSEWRGLARSIGEEVRHSTLAGTFLGIDDEFGMLLRDEETTHLIPLTTVLEAP